MTNYSSPPKSVDVLYCDHVRSIRQTAAKLQLLTASSSLRTQLGGELSLWDCAVGLWLRPFGLYHSRQVCWPSLTFMFLLLYPLGYAWIFPGSWPGAKTSPFCSEDSYAIYRSKIPASKMISLSHSVPAIQPMNGNVVVLPRSQNVITVLTLPFRIICMFLWVMRV